MCAHRTFNINCMQYIIHICTVHNLNTQIIHFAVCIIIFLECTTTVVYCTVVCNMKLNCSETWGETGGKKERKKERKRPHLRTFSHMPTDN